MRSFALVAAGGTAGTLARWGVGKGLGSEHLVPVATLAVNVAGSFVLGALLAMLATRRSSEHWRLLAGTGFLGGFTTYSALAVETDGLMRSEHVALALTYAVGSVAAGLAAALLGVVVGRRLAR